MRSTAFFALVVLGSVQASLAQAPGSASNERLGVMLADIIRKAMPTEHEKKRNWGGTKRVTSGLRLDGFKVSRRKKQVRHGVWKQYKVSLADAAQPLDVQVESLRSLEPGRVACTVVAQGKISVWAQVRRFNRGVHLGTISVEGESHVRLAIDCEVGVQMRLAPVGMTIDPVVTHSKLDLEEFRLKRLGKLHGDPAKELGRGMRKVAEELLSDKRLTPKLNRAIEKNREKLAVSLAASG